MKDETSNIVYYFQGVINSVKLQINYCIGYICKEFI